MAETQPVFAQDLCYTWQEMRRLNASFVCAAGVNAFDELRVTESSPTAMSVSVSEGGGWVEQAQGTGDEGPYFIYNDDPVTLTVPSNTSGVTRTDRVWAKVCDSQYAAVSSGFELVYEENNVTLDPPADGCSYYLLATISVPHNATQITGTPDRFGATEGQITDNREQWASCDTWNDYVPTWVGTGALDASATARWIRHGDMVTVQFNSVFDAGGSAIALSMSLPIPMDVDNGELFGLAVYRVNATSVRTHYGVSFLSSTTVRFFSVTAPSTNPEVGGTSADDSMAGTFSYQVA